MLVLLTSRPSTWLVVELLKYAFSWLAALFSHKVYTLTIHTILAWENECEFVSDGVCERQRREFAAGCSRPSCV